jgi:uncharacterized protein (TIGR03086 family)
VSGDGGTEQAERHRRFAATFTERVLGTVDWEAPAPPQGWVARDVVRHLVTWFPPFLEQGTGIGDETGIRLAVWPNVDDDPVEAWRVHCDAVQQLLDDPATDSRRFSHPQAGDAPLAEAIDRFYTADVFMHTWDLARATGQDERLDEAICSELLAGMEAIEPLLRASGQFGIRVPIDDDADVQSRFLALIGRDPRRVLP